MRAPRTVNTFQACLAQGRCVCHWCWLLTTLPQCSQSSVCVDVGCARVCGGMGAKQVKRVCDSCVDRAKEAMEKAAAQADSDADDVTLVAKDKDEVIADSLENAGF